MSRKTDGQSKYFRKFTPTSTGVIPKIEEEKIFSINSMRVAITGTCVLEVKAHCVNDTSTTLLKTITSTSTKHQVIDTSTWDYVEYNVVSLTGTPTIVVSGFFQALHSYKELQVGRDYDLMVVSPITSTVDEAVYTLEGVNVMTVRITYENSSNKNVVRVEVM